MSVPASLAKRVAKLAPARSFGRMFWIISAIGTLVTVGLLVALYEWQGRRAILEESARNDRHFVQMVGNIVWDRHEDFVLEMQKLPNEQLRLHPSQGDLHQTIQETVRNSNVLKVKIFSPLDGRTLFSTEPKQIGDKHPGAPLDAALAGKASSKVQHRESFNAVGGQVLNREVFSTYLPYYVNGDANTSRKPDFVMEVYSDVTARVAMHQSSRSLIVAGVLTSLLLMYGMIWKLGHSATKRLTEAEADKLEQEGRIHHQAFHDALTGLPNRMSFTHKCHALDKKPPPSGFAVLYIDLDGFKPVNDSLGHHFGDMVLKKVARRIRRSLREEDKVYRVGGDEFVVMIASDDMPTLEIAARRIMVAVAKPYNLEGMDVALSASIGIGRWPLDDQSLVQVVSCADLAMYSAKRAGANQHAFYTKCMRAEADDQVQLLSGLRLALERQEFELHYQPRVSSLNGRVESFEALLRWRHPEQGLLQPARFIKVLEENSLIVDVGAWVMESAARQLAKWHAEGHRGLHVSVNVAARQFRAKNLVESVEQVLKKTGIPPEALELEITEGQLIHDLDHAAQTVVRLKALGVMLSIDDFGTGYSSLSYLQKLPIDCLKIDRSFVKDLDEGAMQNNIARTIASLAHSLEMTVVAEGVETDVQASLLRNWGCEQLQGFLFSKPVPADEAALLIENQRNQVTQPVRRKTRALGGHTTASIYDGFGATAFS